MGFGLLLIGYFMATLMSLNMLGGAFSLAGFLLMLFGSKKLMQYNRSFLLLLCASAVMAVLSAFMAYGDITSLLLQYTAISVPAFPENIALELDGLRTFAELVFVVIMCISVRNISKETGSDKTEYAAVRNLVFFCLSFVLQVVVWLSGIVENSSLAELAVKTALPIWSMLVYIVCQLMLCFMLFSCYAKICDVNDVEMKQKPSRFAFINRQREKSEARHKQYMEEAAKYSEEQLHRSSVNQKKKKKRR